MAPKKFFWVNKTARSEILSRSGQAEETKVRSHVQRNRSDETRCPTEHTETRSITLAGTRSRHAFVETYVTMVKVPAPLSVTNQALTSDERRSFAFFLQRTSLECAGWEDASFWTSTILKASQRSKAIVHGLISLSSIHESRENGQRRRALNHFAQVQMSKSIRELNGSPLVHLDALMSCIVLICLQNAQSGRQTFQLLRAGERILQECDALRRNRSIQLCSEDLEVLEKYVRPLLQRLRARLCVIGDPVSSFAISIAAIQPQTSVKWIDPMPVVSDRFITLRSARDDLSSILDWCCRAISACDGDTLLRADILSHLRFLCYSWEKALHKNSSCVSRDESRCILVSKNLLLVGCLFGRILIETFSKTSECVYDAYVEEFAAIIKLAEEACTVCSMSFGIDSGLVDIIGFTGKHCRHPTVRRAAVKFLACGGRIEGDRASSISSKIIQALIELEEKDLNVTSCADIPDSRRWRILQGAQYHAAGKLQLFLTNSLDPDFTLQLWLPLPCFAVDECDVSKELLQVPDIIFRRGSVAFLENRKEVKYYQLYSNLFYFPVPRS